MDYNINLYEEVYVLKQELASALNRIILLETEKQKTLDIGWYTVDEICSKYSFSRKKFFDYKKLNPLHKAVKLGRIDRYKKTEVHKWLEQIKELKVKTPSLFRPNAFD